MVDSKENYKFDPEVKGLKINLFPRVVIGKCLY